QPTWGTTTCIGMISKPEKGWHKIVENEICHFDGRTDAGARILVNCREETICRVKAYGTWAREFYITRGISVCRIAPDPQCGKKRKTRCSAATTSSSTAASRRASSGHPKKAARDAMPSERAGDIPEVPVEGLRS